MDSGLRRLLGAVQSPNRLTDGSTETWWRDTFCCTKPFAAVWACKGFAGREPLGAALWVIADHESSSFINST